MKSIPWAILTFRSPTLMTAIPGEHFLHQANNLLRTKGQNCLSLGLTEFFTYSCLEIDIIGASCGGFQGLVCKSTLGFSVIYPYSST